MKLEDESQDVCLSQHVTPAVNLRAGAEDAAALYPKYPDQVPAQVSAYVAPDIRVLLTVFHEYISQDEQQNIKCLHPACITVLPVTGIKCNNK
jgi:hypothetical protein